MRALCLGVACVIHIQEADPNKKDLGEIFAENFSRRCTTYERVERVGEHPVAGAELET